MTPFPERIGPYRILRRIGKGGFGEVFAAVHEHMGLQVALKVLLSEHAQDPDTVARFIREARALAQFGKHPGIVQVHHFDRPEGGVAYLAMELLEGKTLRAWLREQTSPVPLESALAICRHVAAIMIDVHALKFVHRDLKPENIMLVPDEREPIGFRPKLLDFGIAKAPEPAFVDGGADTHIKTSGHNVLGSVVYMAPEQFKNADNITEKADVYVLGLVVYELLAGKPPFLSDEEMELIWMHGRDIPKNLDDVVPSVPPKLATFVASMLAKVPEERPSMRDCRDMFARDWTHENTECPFPGLQPFKDSQAHLFFGRRAETHAIRAKLDEIREGTSRRWLQIQGPSGTGKSSLVHAAILPTLMGSKQWDIICMRPADDPIRSLGAAFAKAYEQNESDVVTAFRENPAALDEFVDKHHASDTKLLLVIDQFEELFALGSAQLPTFEKLLAKIFENVNSPLRILTTIRSDYLHRFDHALGLARLLDTHALRYDLRPMDEAALAEVIGGMAARAGLRLSDGLAQEMVRDAAGTEYRLPLLGHALRSLWYLRGGGEILHEHYAKMGGVGGALAKHAGRLLGSLSEQGQERAKWMVLDLVQVGQGAPDTRRPRTRAEVMRAADMDERTEEAWMRLSGVAAKESDVEPFRLLVVSGDSADPDQQRVDLVHEMVLHKVPIVVEWIHAERQFLELLAALESAALTWRRAEKKDGLPSGTLLDHYRGGKDEARRARLLRMASSQAREFLQEATRLERRQRRTWMAIGTAMFAAVVAIVMIAVVAVQARERAEKNLEVVLDTTDKVVNDVDWPMGRLGHTLKLRRKIMERLHARLLDMEKGDPNGLRVRLIETEQRLSDLERLHGKIEAADRLAAKADERISSALSLDPENVDLVALHAMNLSKRGKLKLMRGDTSGALQDFTNSVREFEVTHSKSDYSDDQTLATSHLEMGDALMAQQAFDLAMKSYNTGLSMRRRAADTAKPNELLYARAMVAEALVSRTRITKDSAALARDLSEALEITQSIVKEQDYDLFYQSIHGMIHLGIAGMYRSESRLYDAREEYVIVMKIGESLHKDAPEQKEYALLYIESLMGLETVAREAADTVETDRYRQQWRDLAQSFVEHDPQDLRFQKLLRR